MPRLLALLCTLAILAVLAPTGAGADSEAPFGDDAAARRAVAALTRATTVNDADGDKVFDELEQAFLAAPGERQRTIVLFTAGTATDEGVDAVRRAAPDADVADTFTVVPSLVAWMTADEADAVADLSAVRQVELDTPGTPELDQATGVMGADTVVEVMGVTGDLDGNPAVVTTDDVGIAILDSGFHAAHEQLDDGKLTAFVDLGNGLAEPYDNNGHGTHVANIAAGWGNENAQYRGVAPGAGVIGLKIEGGSGSESNAIAGFQWLVDNREAFNVRVATISYGFGTATDGTTAVELAVDAAWDAGIVVFKSTGNSGPGNGTMTVPAAARGIIAMGSLIDPFGSSRAGFSLSSFSSRGPTTDGRIKPDLAAPGDGIMAAQTGTRSGYVSKSGTSMASPFGAGVAALVVAANPALSPDEVRQILFDTAEDFGAEGEDNDFGRGRIRAEAAVEAALVAAGEDVPTYTPVPVPLHEGIVVTADLTGRATTTVDVTDTVYPLAVTAMGEDGAIVLGVDVTSGSGLSTGVAINTGAHRHGYDSVARPAVGTYTVTVLTQPLADVVLAVSHSRTAPQ
ncbi:S8 family serine peptidase [Euzebya rosea]|uniref:S8 family serine peptidase n=1 Tax=Euzebya rosea TaxID=2052804 RepID=UPI000D3E7F62|nr:S8 family serine peptidase [Euzebya rosea]